MLAALALLFAWPCPPAAAAAQGAGTDPARAERALAAEERRILSLVDGRKLRAVARQRADTWEVRDGNVWLVLPEGLVQSVASERELLARLHELAARGRPDDLARKCALAEWMLQQGLLAEALGALDQILLVDPEQAAARALLARAAIPVALPRAAEDAAAPARERLDALLRFGAQSRPSVRELVVTKLAALPEPALLQEALLRETRNGVLTRRAFGLFAMRRMFPGSSVHELQACATFDPSADVRVEAALGLRLAGSPARVVPLVHVLAREDPAARVHAIEALGTIGDLVALEPLLVHLARLAPPSASGGGAARSHLFVGNQVSYLRDFDAQIAQGSSIADPIPDVVGEGAQIDVRVLGVESVTPAAERRAICRALARLTGEKPTDDPEHWLDWWKRRSEAAERASGSTPR